MADSTQDDPEHPSGLPALLPAPADPGAQADETEKTTTTGEGWRVLLFNDEDHSMDEVALQIVLATGCPLTNAVDIMLRAHRNGQATVVIAAKAEADRVATVLRRIALRVRVEQV